MKNYVIKNQIKRIPKGMEINRRIYHISSPIGLISKVYQEFDNTEAFAIMRIVSYIRIMQKQFAHGNNLYVNISWEILRACAGDDYRKYLFWLVKNDVIEINESYSTTQRFTKSYRYTDKSFRKALTVTKWYVDVLNETKETYINKIKETVFTPEGKYDNELLYCLEHENLLSIPNAEEIIDSLPDDIKSYASECFYTINKGMCYPKPQTKSTRFYFNSIMMSSDLRKYLIYDKKETMVNFDIKTAYPAFTKLLAIYKNTTCMSNIFTCMLTDGDDKKVLYDFYNAGDFYDLLKKGSNLDRTQIKKEYNKYTNSNDTEYKKNHIFSKRLIEMGHNDMVDYIINAKDIWTILEEAETFLLVYICNTCIYHQIPFIRQHDGFLTTYNFLYTINEHLKTGYAREFKFEYNLLTPIL